MQSVSWRFSVWFMIMKTDWLERTDRSVFPHFFDSEIQVERSLFDSHIDHAPFLTQTLVTHLTFHSPYSLSQPYDGKFSGLPMLTACSVISISGLDDTGSPDSWYHIWFYKKHYFWYLHTPEMWNSLGRDDRARDPLRKWNPQIFSSSISKFLPGFQNKNKKETWGGSGY